MQKSISILVFILLSVVAVLAVPSFKPDVRIINGKSAESGQFPFIEALRIGIQQYSTGFIIHKNWIITAAHCVEAIFIAWPQILVGTNLLQYVKQKKITNLISLHALQKIGLMKIDGEFEFNAVVQPIDFRYAESNDTVTAVGWELTEELNSLEGLRYVKLRAFSLEECQKIANNYTEYLYVGPEQVCALANDKGVCYGDSGGPLISNGKLVGLVSYVFAPCAEGIPDVYTRPVIGTITLRK